MTGLNILLFETLFSPQTNGYINKPNISEGNLASSNKVSFFLFSFSRNFLNYKKHFRTFPSQTSQKSREAMISVILLSFVALCHGDNDRGICSSEW